MPWSRASTGAGYSQCGMLPSPQGSVLSDTAPHHQISAQKGVWLRKRPGNSQQTTKSSLERLTQVRTELSLCPCYVQEQAQILFFFGNLIVIKTPCCCSLAGIAPSSSSSLGLTGFPSSCWTGSSRGFTQAKPGSCGTGEWLGWKGLGAFPTPNVPG